MTLESISLADYNMSIPVSTASALIAGDTSVCHFTALKKFILFIKSIFTGVYEPDVYRAIYHHLHATEAEMDLFTEQWKPMNAFTRFIDLTKDDHKKHFTLDFADHEHEENSVTATFKFNNSAIADIVISSEIAAQLIDIYATSNTDVVNKIELYKSGKDHENDFCVNAFFIEKCFDMVVNIQQDSGDNSLSSELKKYELETSSWNNIDDNSLITAPPTIPKAALQHSYSNLITPPIA